MKTYKEFITEITNAMGGGFEVGQASSSAGNIAGYDPVLGSPRKRKQGVKEMFAGCPVFTISSDDYHKCMHGRMRYERWNKKLNMEDFGNQDIRSYAHKNPGEAVIVKDATHGMMSYFIPPTKKEPTLDEGGFTVPGYDQDAELERNLPRWKKEADARTRKQMNAAMKAMKKKATPKKKK